MNCTDNWLDPLREESACFKAATYTRQHRHKEWESYPVFYVRDAKDARALQPTSTTIRLSKL
jgi:hypothetical protein